MQVTDQEGIVSKPDIIVPPYQPSPFDGLISRMERMGQEAQESKARLEEMARTLDEVSRKLSLTLPNEA